VVRVCFRVLTSPNLGSSWLASSPSALSIRGPPGLRFKQAIRPSQRPNPSSRALHRHLGVFTPQKPPPYSRPTSTAVRFPKAPRGSFPALQHLRSEKPFFPLSSRRASETHCPASRKTRPRVWLPSRRAPSSPHLGSLFQLPTLVGFAL
jgi:hypothetical protein